MGGRVGVGGLWGGWAGEGGRQAKTNTTGNGRYEEGRNLFRGNWRRVWKVKNFSWTTTPNAGRDRAISCTTTPSLGLEGPSLILGDYIRDRQGPSLFLGHSHTARQGPSLFRCHSYHRRNREGGDKDRGPTTTNPGRGHGREHVDPEPTKRISKCTKCREDVNQYSSTPVT